MKTKDILSIISIVLCIISIILYICFDKIKIYGFLLVIVIVLLSIGQILKDSSTPSSGPTPHPSPAPHPSGPTELADVNVDVFFPPYDCPTKSQTMIDLAMIDAVTNAAKNYKSSTPLNHNDPNNPFQIKYCVYNLYDESYLEALKHAYNTGVYVQVLIQYTQLEASYNHTHSEFSKAGMEVCECTTTKGVMTCTTQQQKPLPANFDTLNLIAIESEGSLMHCKTRYYKMGRNPVQVKIGDTTRNITEAIVTGSFNPECAATQNNECLIVLTTDQKTTPETISNYLSIYDYVKYNKSSQQKPEPPIGDDIFNINKALYVNYSGWCKNGGNSYMRKIMMNLIDNEKDAILLPLYSLSNLDSPNENNNPVDIDVKNIKFSPADYSNNKLTATLTLNKNIKLFGVDGIGSKVIIEYQSPGDTKPSSQKFYIRDNTNRTINLIPTGRKSITGDDTITDIKVYETILTHFENAIDRSVKVILLINKAQADGEIDNTGSSFTGGDATLTSFLMQQMGALVWKCTNPMGELHSKNGYFYSQNTLITDTTNWSNAGMGYQGATGPNCTTVNDETCLVIKGDYLKETDKDIFKYRILANFANTARMYAYQQPCGYKDSGKFGNRPVPKPLNIINTANCTCPPSPAGVMCLPNSTKSSAHGGTCNVSIDKSHSKCYVTAGSGPSGCYGACTVDCCLRNGQTAPNPNTTTFKYLMGILSNLPNWPKFACIGNSIKNPIALGSYITVDNKKYIIDPTFNWGGGLRINNKYLLESIKSRDILSKNMTAVTDIQGEFCSITPSACQ